MPWQYFYRQRHLLDTNLVKGTSDQREFVGHSEGVYCIQADERKLVSGSRDDTIRIWDLSTGRSTHTLAGHNGSVLCLEFNRTHLDFSIRLWDWGTGKCTGQFDGHAAAVNAVQVHGDVLVSASGDKKLRIWDLRAPTAKAEVGKLEGHARGIACVAFDGRYVCSGTPTPSFSSATPAAASAAVPPQPGTIAPSPAQVRVITGHDDLVRTLQFSAADNVLVSGSYDESVRIWRLSTGEQMHKLVAPARVFNVQWQAGMVYVALQTEKLVEYNFRRGVDMRGILPPPRW
ncbi:WD40-repeat-containing domain protein [Catenaria anguillulae PL171]|uniref:WD40-repeat-containing domain protein n=1 Tax=Catenaria anguillulae PL171 TaxID=765915 RepID=A0A1Y2HU24_9FUNG|nr:WD40-repeat-containing domain protein [Catenaria anguillulae PL171]